MGRKGGGGTLYTTFLNGTILQCIAENCKDLNYTCIGTCEAYLLPFNQKLTLACNCIHLSDVGQFQRRLI